MISKLDFIGIPSRDAERSRSFYDLMLQHRYAPHG